MWQQSPVQADWWLCLRPVAVATPWGETGLAGWQATRRTIQFNSIQFDSRPNSNSISIASCQLPTCNVQLVAEWFYFWVYQRINCNIFGHFLCLLRLLRLPCVVFRPSQWHVAQFHHEIRLISTVVCSPQSSIQIYTHTHIRKPIHPYTVGS